MQKDKDLTERAISLMTDQLKGIKRVVPSNAVKKLQKVHLWISPESPGIVPRAEYHPGAQWLIEHGRDPIMVHGVEITNIRIFEAECHRMPWFILHELAHSYHDQVLGFSNKRIQTAYEHAVAGGKYDNVLMWNGKHARAYAMTNAQEYFAEGTESFFGRNDFYPFDRADLKVADPELTAIMEDAWFK